MNVLKEKRDSKPMERTPGLCVLQVSGDCLGVTLVLDQGGEE